MAAAAAAAKGLGKVARLIAKGHRAGKAAKGGRAIEKMGSIGKKTPAFHKFMWNRGYDFGRHPILSSINYPTGAVMAGSLGYHALGGDELMDADANFDEMVKRNRAAQQSAQQQLRYQQQVVAKAERNMILIAQKAPHLYNELMAGRRLPPDATVFGGTPRTDVLEEIAMDMATGNI